MKTISKNAAIVVMLICLISGCSTPNYVPLLKDAPTASNGAYMVVTQINGHRFNGELIAADSNAIFIMDKHGNLQTIEKNSIHTYAVQFAKGKSFVWLIAPFSAWSFLNGLMAVFALPVNLVCTLGVTQSGYSAFKLRNNQLKYDQLNAYARYPQGIPSNIQHWQIR